MGKILIIDDEPDTRELLMNRLEGSGYEAAGASGPSEALRHLRQDKPDLIILDVLMPEMTGYDFLQVLKKNGEWKSIPVLVMSGRRSMQDFFNSWEVQGFVPKPFSAEEFLAAVGRIVKPRTGAKAPVQAAPSQPGFAVLVVCQEDYLAEKLVEGLKKESFQAEATPDEEDAVARAQARKFAAVFCQYADNPGALDTRRIQKRLASAEASARAAFFVICKKDYAVEAIRIFGRTQVLSYEQTEELFKKTLGCLKSNSASGR